MDMVREAEATELPPILDGRAAGAVLDTLRAKRGAAIVLDGSKVERLGAQVLQVLLSAAATCRADGVAFAVVSPSEGFITGLRVLGVPLESITNEECAA